MFKYMSAEVAPLFAKTLMVRFTQPSDLNDPFELRPLIDFRATAEELHGHVDAKITEMFGTVDGTLRMIEQQQASDPNFPKLVAPIQVIRKMIKSNPGLGQQFMAEMQRHKAEMLDNARMALAWEAQWEQLQKIVGQVFGIFSLTEDPANTLMWSHYASQHYGIVVEFDTNDRWFEQKKAPQDEFRHLVQVTYIQNPHPRTIKQLTGVDLLYTKSAEWTYEREWRIIRPVRDGIEVSQGKFCFEVPGSAVRSIIFGCRTSSALEKGIRGHITSNPSLRHVRFKRATLAASKIKIVDADFPSKDSEDPAGAGKQT